MLLVSCVTVIPLGKNICRIFPIIFDKPPALWIFLKSACCDVTKGTGATQAVFSAFWTGLLSSALKRVPPSMLTLEWLINSFLSHFTVQPYDKILPFSRLYSLCMFSKLFSFYSYFTRNNLSFVCPRFRCSRRASEAHNAHAHGASSASSSNGHPSWREAASQWPGLLAGQPRGQSVSQHFGIISTSFQELNGKKKLNRILLMEFY